MPTESMDPYVYPGTNVLKNRRDIRDWELLSKFEMDMTTRRASELLLKKKPIGKFDLTHLKQIHGYRNRWFSARQALHINLQLAVRSRRYRLRLFRIAHSEAGLYMGENLRFEATRPYQNLHLTVGEIKANNCDPPRAWPCSTARGHHRGRERVQWQLQRLRWPNETSQSK